MESSVDSIHSTCAVDGIATLSLADEAARATSRHSTGEVGRRSIASAGRLDKVWGACRYLYGISW